MGEGDEYIVNGRKWFITGVTHPDCKFAVVLGVSDPNGAKHNSHSMVLVPMDAPGVTVVRNIPVMNHMIWKAIASWSSKMSAFRSPICWARKARASRWPRPALDRAGCITACARSASANWRWS